MSVLIGTTHAYAMADLSVGTPLWAALFHTTPTLIDPLSGEVAGGGYARPQATMQRTGRRLVNANALIFPGVPAGVMVALGLFTASVNGEIWLASTFSPHLSTPGGKSIVLEPGEVAFAL